MMRAIGFEGLEEHKAAHEQLINKIFSIVQEFENGTLLVSDDLNQFLRDWLLEHILKRGQVYELMLDVLCCRLSNL